MKYLILILTTCFGFTFGFAQVELSRTHFNLGEISLLNADIVDFNIDNVTQEAIYILRIDAEQGVGIQYTSKTIRAGSEESIRIKLNPSRRGKITRKVSLFLSTQNDPIEITVSGNVKSIPKNNKQACPQFGAALKPPTGKVQVVAKIKQFDLAFYNEDSNEQIASAQTVPADVALTQEASTPILTSTQTRPSRPLKNKKQKKTPEERRNSPSIGQILFGKTTDTTSIVTEEVIEEEDHVGVVRLENIDEQKEEPETKEEELEVVEANDELATEEANSNLLDDSFKPNNIVFLIDASNSMKEEERMDILKSAMIELLAPLREIDFLTIVTYSGEAKVIMPPTSGKNKEEIADQINNLIADGSTNAVKGIKTAIKTGQSSFIEEGNNQIILATDGAFDIGRKNVALRQKIKRTAEDGLSITVLGIKNENWTNESLNEIVELGSGDLIRIRSYRDASKVLKEVKKKARKR